MAWEDRNGRHYYYRKRREGKRVISEYIGAGLAGQIAEIFDMEDRHETNYNRALFQGQKESAQTIADQVRQIEKFTRAMTRAVLLMSGYHAHKRQWRKYRNGRSNQNND
jgi:hypothetical protein